MIKWDLAQIDSLNREVKYLKRKLAELKADSISISIPRSETSAKGQPGDRVGRYGSKIVDLESLLEHKIQEHEREACRLTKYIQQIPHSDTRMIFMMRYIDGMTWLQIAFCIGRYDEQYPRKKHDRFLQMYEKYDWDELK